MVLMFLASCSLSRSIEQNQHIVAKNNIKIKDNKTLTKVELETYIVQQQTPKALAFFYSNLWIYQSFKKKKNNGFNRWVMKVFGDEPIIWNATDTRKSEKDITAYLNNIGYFNAEVHSSISKKPYKTFITYHVLPGKAYTIDRIDYEVADSALLNIDIKKNSLIDVGDPFNSYHLDDERDRISELLRNNGYYEFNAEYISFKVDSSLRKHAVNLATVINPFNINTQDSVPQSFTKYNIHNVYIFTDFERDQKFKKAYDTLVIDLGTNKHAKATGKYHFLYKNKLRINPNIIAQSIFIEPDENFNSRDLKETYQKLNHFPTFKYVDISFKKTQDTNYNELDTHIKLFRSKLHYFSIETDGTNSSGDLGVRLGINYGNRNLFKGGEYLNLRLTTAVENRKYSGYENTTRFLLFNTLEYGVILSIYSPSFIVPIRQSRFPKYFKPQTFIRLGYNYQLRPSYKRHLSNLQFGYEWKQSKFKFHRLTPIDLSIIKIFPTQEFQASIDSITNPRYKDQYSDHFIASVKYDFVYNTQEFQKHESFKFFTARFESAGNITYGLHELFNAPKTEGYYQIAGIRFAQYLRVEFDYRQYIALTNKQGFIYRLNTGLGLPYGNSLAMPFEKGFYGGGANGMRAWAYRDLGPGTYNNSLGPSYDKMGDVKIEANIEYRFPLYGYLKGAAFVDLGNIWLLHQSETFPGGAFNWDTFYTQFAMDAGVGFRLDLDFFIVRLDGALKVQDPSRLGGERFVLPKSQISDIFWSFGIGYPF